MKKLLFGIAVILMISACKDGTKQKDNETHVKKVLSAAVTSQTSIRNLFTLNGLPLFEADAMVNTFLNYKGSYDSSSPTCIWYSQAAFKQMYTFVENLPNSDGVRMYFAKTIPDGEYTLVVVATTDGGLVAPNDPQNLQHIHNDSFFSTNPSMPGVDINGQLGSVTPTEGAILYGRSPCGVDNCPPSTTSNHYISCDIAYKMINNIGSEEINATSEWFDKGIIEQLYKKMAQGGGIRIYFAKHLKAALGDSEPRHGFVLILTTPIANNVQMDDYQCFTLVPKYDYLKKHPRGPGDGGGTDNGEECPASCKGTTWE